MRIQLRRRQRAQEEAAAVNVSDEAREPTGRLFVPGVHPFESADPRFVVLEVPGQGYVAARSQGARWDPRRRVWYVLAEERDRFDRWLPSSLVDLGPVGSETTRLGIVGLVDPCWRCRAIGTSLMGFTSPGASPSSLLMTCEDELALALADRYLPEEARMRWQVGAIKRRWSKTSRECYLSNGCPSCDALRGNFILFHEALAEERALGGDSLVEVAVVDLPLAQWQYVRELIWQ